MSKTFTFLVIFIFGLSLSYSEVESSSVFSDSNLNKSLRKLRKKKVFKSAKLALKSFRKFKKENKEAMKSVRRLRRSIRKKLKKVTDLTERKVVVRKEIEEARKKSSLFFQNLSCDYSGANLIIGFMDGECDQSNFQGQFPAEYDPIKLAIYNLGLRADFIFPSANSIDIFCLLEHKGINGSSHNIGVSASAGIFFGAGGAVYVGMNGVCLAFNYGIRLGWGVSASLMSFSNFNDHRKERI